MIRLPATVAVVLTAASIAFGQWSAPVNVSRVLYGRTWYQGIAVDSFGTVHACWSHIVSNNFEWVEYSCKAADADTFSTPVHVSRDSFPYRGTAIAIGPGHVPYVIWQSDYEPGHIYISRKMGDTWTIPVRLAAWNQSGRGLRAASDRFERIHVVWNDAGYVPIIWYASYDATGWSAPETVALGLDTFHIGWPSVAADWQGQAHVVYSVTLPYAVGAGYVYQTGQGWSTPSYLPTGSNYLAYEPRIAMDSQDAPQAIWYESRHIYFSALRGDSWIRPERLDSGIDASTGPQVCVDAWNQIHAVFGDRGYGFREALRWQDRWYQTLTISQVQGAGEVAVRHSRIHVLWGSSETAGDMWYSYRDLLPPSVAESNAEKPLCGSNCSVVPLAPSTVIPFYLDRRETVRVDFLDAAGRCIKHLDLGVLAPGQHSFRPYDLAPANAVSFCRIQAGRMESITKLVRTD